MRSNYFSEPSEDRTFRMVFEMPRVTNHQLLTRICKHQYRNPIFLAQEWQRDLADRKYNSRADLSCKMRVSIACLIQVLNLLKLPGDIIEMLKEKGDSLPKRALTERSLRRLLKDTCKS